MNEYIEENIEDITLSDKDMMRMCEYKVSIHAYEQLTMMSDYTELFNGKDGCILLYETRHNFGHWVLLINMGDHVEFFDPLGIKMDQELKIVPEYIRAELHEDIPHLTHLLQNVHVVENTTQLQRIDHEINTCGRHVVSRFKMYLDGFTDLPSYLRLFEKQKEDPDMTVSKLTLLL